MSVKRFTDWEGYWIGLRQNILKCIGTTGITWLGTNGLQGAGVNVPGIDWKQALAMFSVHIGFEVFAYLQKNQPIVTESSDVTVVSTNDSGEKVTVQSKTTIEKQPEPKA